MDMAFLFFKTCLQKLMMEILPGNGCIDCIVPALQVTGNFPRIHCAPISARSTRSVYKY